MLPSLCTRIARLIKRKVPFAMDFPSASDPVWVFMEGLLCFALLLYHNAFLRGYPYGPSRSICEHLIGRLRTLSLPLDPQNRVPSLLSRLLTDSILGLPPTRLYF